MRDLLQTSRPYCFVIAALALLLAMGCDDGANGRSNDDAGGDAGGDASEDAALDAEVEPLFETCKEVKEAAIAETGKAPANGTYTLYVDGDADMPWDAYCHRMNLADPTEYLTVNEDDNESQISDGAHVATTTYRRYRIDPQTLVIDPIDDTFATNEGFEDFEPILPEELTSIPAGWAQFQPLLANDGPPAEAHVDLAGTPFAFDESILANNLDTFFCKVSDNLVLGDDTESSAEVASDLASFELHAINSNSDSPNNAVTRMVADCDHLGIDPDFTSGTWPLVYVNN